MNGRMHRLRSGKTASSVSSHRPGPQLEETQDSVADASVSLSPPILSSQVTSSEAMRGCLPVRRTCLIPSCSLWQILC